MHVAALARGWFDGECIDRRQARNVRNDDIFLILAAFDADGNGSVYPIFQRIYGRLDGFVGGVRAYVKRSADALCNDGVGCFSGLWRNLGIGSGYMGERCDERLPYLRRAFHVGSEPKMVFALFLDGVSAIEDAVVVGVVGECLRGGKGIVLASCIHFIYMYGGVALHLGLHLGDGELAIVALNADNNVQQRHVCLSLKCLFGGDGVGLHLANGKLLRRNGRHFEGETLGCNILTRGVTQGNGTIGRGGKQLIEMVVAAEREVGFVFFLRSEVHFQFVGGGQLPCGWFNGDEPAGGFGYESNMSVEGFTFTFVFSAVVV